MNLNAASPQLVVEANVFNSTGPYYVQLSKTVNFSDPNNFPAVTGALVKITDSTSHFTDILTETTPGIYATKNIQGIPGHTYQLYITTGGQSYTAQSTMPQPVPFDSLTFDKLTAFGNTNINAIPNYKDPAGIANYYNFTLFVNRRKINNIFAFDDRLSDGRYMTRVLRTDSTYISLGDTVRLIMSCIDKSTYNYFSTLGQVAGNNFQSVSPTNPNSNISNNALGYFSASTLQSKSAIAK